MLNEMIESELHLFKYAKNWKKYWSRMIECFLTGDILEIGSGIGTSTQYLYNDKVKSVTSVEPDTSLANTKYKNIDEIINCGKKYDVAVYIDVLEHIADDKLELEKALKVAYRVVALCPAHNFLMTEFDHSIGHYRRYNRKLLEKITPEDYKLEVLYLDSLGLVFSASNIFLKQKRPSVFQVKVWDTCIPFSKIFDSLTGYYIGKSIMAVWTKK